MSLYLKRAHIRGSVAFNVHYASQKTTHEQECMKPYVHMLEIHTVASRLSRVGRTDCLTAVSCSKGRSARSCCYHDDLWGNAADVHPSHHRLPRCRHPGKQK
jgi:hypothetical protein